MENNRRELRPAAVSVGHRLKEAREKKGLVIDQVQKQTKIHSTVLIALEEGRASDLLTDTYVRSFLKKYAQFLGVSSTDILKEYFPASANSAPLNIPVRENARFTKETTAKPKFLYFTAVTAGVLILIVIFVMLIGRISAHFKQPKSAKQKRVALAVKKKDAQAAKAPVRKKTTELIPRTTPLTLVIKVKEPVLLSIKKDGILMSDSILRKGMIETVTANNNIELGRIGKAQALELTLNGRPVQLPANKAILGLEITRKGIRVK